VSIGVHSAGLKEVNSAKADGRWATAYDLFGGATIPEDFLNKLAQDKAASARASA
jgi:uncharacterized protein YdeI (YjbR/CyaY-like superfamily)